MRQRFGSEVFPPAAVLAASSSAASSASGAGAAAPPVSGQLRRHWPPATRRSITSGWVWPFAPVWPVCPPAVVVPPPVTGPLCGAGDSCQIAMPATAAMKKITAIRELRDKEIEPRVGAILGQTGPQMPGSARFQAQAHPWQTPMQKPGQRTQGPKAVRRK